MPHGTLTLTMTTTPTIGLCLSGGGFRAALFHLGVLRRLDELGLLGSLRTISSVSGGSIMAGHLATALSWPRGGDDFETRVAVPFRRFTSRDIRTKAILKGLLPGVTSIEELVKAYEQSLTSKRLLDLPEAPRFVFCSTDMSYGCNFVFSRDTVGDYQIGYAKPPENWSIGRAVAASSCFPPIFNPMQPKLDGRTLQGGSATRGRERDECIADLRLTDGGNYDNMGLEPVWKNHDVVLVSDGGGVFDFSGDRALPTRLLRYTAIIERQALGLRRRWLVSSFVNGSLRGAYWGIGGARASYGMTGGYSYEIAELIAGIRTDLDAFSEAEAFVLENHGYSVSDAAIRKHASTLIVRDAPFAVPHPEWLDESRVRNALKQSAKRKLLGRR
jgi:NTE family protein